MRTCTYCGKEYSDDVAVCGIDGKPLPEAAIPPLINAPAAASSPLPLSNALKTTISGRGLRLVELLLVCSIAFGSSILACIYSLLGEPLPSTGAARWINGILHQTSTLALLWYVLLRRSKSLFDLGFGLKWSDFGWSIVLRLAGWLAFSLVYKAIYYSGLASANGTSATLGVATRLFGSGVFLSTLIFICINPFFEELIVRAYLMTEVHYLTNSAVIAVIVSTAVQTSYHFYQGVPLALSEGAEFFIWSLFYARTRRITPIILAHFYADAMATLWYTFHHHIGTGFGAS